MNFSLRDLPIRRKLTVITLFTISIAILLMGSALIIYERVTFQRALEVNIRVLGRIIGSNSTAALAFDDTKNAREILSALAAEKQVTAAAIYDRNGHLFASFPANAVPEKFPQRPGPYRQEVVHDSLIVVQPIMQEGSSLGTTYLQADLGEMYDRFRAYGVLLLGVAAFASLAALAVSARMQRRIAGPILDLAEVATAVSQRHDYSVRAVKHGKDEIGQLTEAFNEMLARIGESRSALAASGEELRLANREKDRFLAILSHELRTPLTPVLAALSALEHDEKILPEMHQELDMIRRNVEVEARLIDDLLDITSISRGKLQLKREVVDVRALLEHAITNYGVVSAERKNIRITLQADASETHAFVDSSRITQVFWNLLQNACKFTPIGGAVTVRMFNDGSSATNGANQPQLVVEVIDNGLGIAPETLPKIFNAFEQGERTRRGHFGGLGLGLSISRAIIELHGGSISAESEGRDKGAKLTVHINTVAPSTADASHPSSGPGARVAPPHPLRILIVEDHVDTAEQFERLLKRVGHEVASAGTIREAREAASRGTPDHPPFDLVISDLDLPDGNGRDLMRDLASRFAMRGIALSGHGMKEDVESSLAAGFSVHLTKPINWQELKTAIDGIAAENPVPADRVG